MGYSDGTLPWPCCTPMLLRVLSANDTVHKRFLKSWVHFASLLVFGLSGALLIGNYAKAEVEEVYFWHLFSMCTLATWGLVAQAVLQVTRDVTPLFMSGTILALFTGLLFADVGSAHYVDGREWPWIIVVVQAAHVFHAHRVVVNTVVVITVLWLLVCAADEALGFGLRSYEPFHNDPAYVPEVCNCPQPPCKRTVYAASAEAASNVCCVLLSFFVVRGLLRAVTDEQKKMTASIDTAEVIAECLSAFDLDAADALLTDSEGLPERLRGALKALLGNLQTYHPYLPVSCLPRRVARSASFDEMCEVLDDTDSSLPSSSSKYASEGGPVSPVSPHPMSPMQRLDAEENVVSPTKACINRFDAVDAAPERRFDNGAGSPPTTPRRKSVHSLTSLQSSTKLPSMPDLLRTQQQPQTSRVTLVLCNLHDTLAWHADLDHLRTRIDGMVARAVDAFGKKGIVDHFMGDRIFASYNASRPTWSPAVHALRAACNYIQGFDVGINVAVSTGRAVCGDVGSATMRRYTIFGALSLQVAGLERFGRAFAVRIACNQASYMDANHQFELRRVARNLQMVKCVPKELHCRPGSSKSVPDEVRGLRGVLRRRSKENTDDPPVEPQGMGPEPRPVGALVAVYEAEQAGERPAAAGPQEWMYELEAGAAVWESYNAAMAVYLNTGNAVSAVDMVPEALRPALAAAIGDAPPPPPFEIRV